MGINLNYSQREVKTFTIANGASVSDVIDLKGFGVVAIRFPAAFTGAAIRMHTSEDAAMATPLVIGAMDGTAYEAIKLLNGHIQIPYGIADCLKFLRLQSVDGSHAAQAEGGARTVTVICAPRG